MASVSARPIRMKCATFDCNECQSWLCIVCVCVGVTKPCTSRVNFDSTRKVINDRRIRPQLVFGSVVLWKYTCHLVHSICHTISMHTSNVFIIEKL